ncbi:response regulator [Patescibacteria group bacterium]|nr:response regulator [Patescibacteria group bacterium]
MDTSPSPYVLVVDDNREITKGLVRLIMALGWSARGAYSAKEAIAHLEAGEVELLLIDINMPEMDGYELIAFLRNEMRSVVPTIALTGYGLSEDRQKALHAGFNAHLTKPIGKEELERAIGTFLLSSLSNKKSLV